MMLEFIVCYCWVLYCVGMFFLVILTLNEYLLIHDNERDCLVHYSLQFEGCEAYQTKDYFIAWANFLKGLTEDGYLPYWHK